MILICVIIFARFLICMKFQFVDKFSVCIQTIYLEHFSPSHTSSSSPTLCLFMILFSFIIPDNPNVTSTHPHPENSA